MHLQAWQHLLNLKPRCGGWDREVVQASDPNEDHVLDVATLEEAERWRRTSRTKKEALICMYKIGIVGHLL